MTIVRRWIVLCCLGAAVLAALACAGDEESVAPASPAVQEEAPPSVPAAEPATVGAVDAATEEVAMGFMEAGTPQWFKLASAPCG
jgi:hypothetical protein